MTSSTPYEVYFSPTFLRKMKKSNSKFHQGVRQQVKIICKNPHIGVEKKGDLQGIFVHKFKFNRQEQLLSYKFDEKSRTMLMIGTHENYYRDLKKQL